MKYKDQEIKSLLNVDEVNNIAETQLYGQIGKDINGNFFAQDLVNMANFGFAEVRININSIGGSITEGFSIINAMNVLRMGGTAVSTRGVGVMDSMAGIILAFGDRGKRSAASFASGVIHEPLFQDPDGNLISLDDLPDGNLKNEATAMREALLIALQGSTGKNQSELAKIMKQGSRRKAAELKDLGMIDNIIELDNKVEIQNKSAIQLMAACANIEISKPNTRKTMNLVNKTLGLNDEANETAQNAAIVALKNQADKAVKAAADLAAKQTELDALKNENDLLKTAQLEAANLAAEAYVDAQIAAGRFSEDKKETLVNQAKANFESFKTLCESLNGEFVDVTKSLGGGDNPAAPSTDKLLNLAKDYHKADVAGTMDAFKNKVGDAQFEKIENYYSENIDKVLTDD